MYSRPAGKRVRRRLAGPRRDTWPRKSGGAFVVLFTGVPVLGGCGLEVFILVKDEQSANSLTGWFWLWWKTGAQTRALLNDFPQIFHLKSLKRCKIACNYGSNVFVYYWGQVFTQCIIFMMDHIQGRKNINQSFYPFCEDVVVLVSSLSLPLILCCLSPSFTIIFSLFILSTIYFLA